MPSWKKVVISGSDASLNSLNISSALTASGLIYPATDGTSGQVITTNGAGQLSFSSLSSGGDGSSIKLAQTVAATTWSFAHNLNEKFPVVTIYDSNDEVIIPQKIDAIDNNSMLIYFSSARTGTAAAVVGGYTVSASYSEYALTASYLEGYISPFPFTGSAQITGSLGITGSVNSSGGFTGSLQGNADASTSASYASNATSASYASNATSASYSSNSTSASYSNIATSASYSSLATSASHALSADGAISASYASNSTSASYSVSASYANNATSASYSNVATSASYSLNATSASYSNNSTSASYALTSSYLPNPTVSGSIGLVDKISFTTGSEYVLNAAQIAWNPADGTFDMGLLNGVTLQVGQEMNFYGKASGAISNGDAVMFAGSQGDHLLMAKATQATINANPEYFIGVATQDFTNNQFGYVTVFGKVRELNTLAYTQGAVLYFDSQGSTAGALTATNPVAPFAKIEVAAVVRVHGTQGVLMVRPHVMPFLADLHDVGITNVTEGDLLVRNSNTWRNTKQLSGSYGLTGSLSATSFVGTLTGNASTATTSSHALTASSVDPLYQDVEIHGNLNVYGTSSFVYVTSSQLDVDNSFISVNVFEPAERFGGMKVYDSGSSDATASFAWDSLHNHWVYQNASGSTYSGGMFLAGPRNTGSLGDEPGLTKWMVARSDGGDHLNDTQIYSSGSITQVTGSLTVTAGITGSLLGSASWASNAVNATSASYALNATNAASATTAGSATSASYALNATNATSATSATTAGSATSASYALNATNATSATSATTATSASYAATATSAASATTAGSATSASYALNSTNAANATSATTATQLNGYSNQSEATILTGPANGPVWKVRYDSATANRYVDLGFKDGNGVYSTGLKLYNGDTPTWQGSTLLHAGNYSSYAVPTTRTITINGTALDLSADRSFTVSSTVTSGISITSAGNASNTPSTPSVNVGVYVDTYAFIDLATANTNGGWIDFSKADGGDYGARIRYVNGSDYLSISAGTNEQLRIFSNNAEALGSFRAPIFYDSNNTGYYVDPASTSNLNVLQTAGIIQGGTYVDCTNIWGGAYRIYNGSTLRGGLGTDLWANGGYSLSSDINLFSSGNTFFNTNQVRNGKLDTSGNFIVSGDVTAYGSPSDIRLKNIKEKIPNALESVLKLNGYRFDWKNPDEISKIKEDIGVIAQEVEAVFPELARTNDNGFMSVRYQGLTAVLIEAIKEQQTQIEELKQLVKQLTNK